MTPRLLLIGLDAGDLPFIRTHRKALPTLCRFVEGGRCYEPLSPKGLSGSVWPTFYTGTPPGEHGLYQHLVWNPETMGLRLIAPDWCRHRPFWSDLDAVGQRVVVMDVPYSFGGHLERGVEVMDWATQGQTQPFYGNRPDLSKRILREFGSSAIGRETPVHKNERQLQRVRRSLVSSARQKGDLSTAFVRELEWDVFITVFGETHRGGHALFSDDDGGGKATPLLDVYQSVDRAVARLLDAVDLDETTVMLFSVHGMTRDDNQAHLVRPIVGRINERLMERHFGLAPKKRAAEGMVRRLRKAVPSSLQLAAGHLAPDAVRRWVVEREIVGGLDWSRTPGFALRTDIRSELRLNLCGREAKGLLEPGSNAHHAYVESLREAICGLKDGETGEALVDELVDIRKLCPGHSADALPDLVIAWRRQEAVRRLSAPSLGDIEVTPAGARGGDHTDIGFALLIGPGAGNPSLPPLKETSDFGRFVTAIARSEQT